MKQQVSPRAPSGVLMTPPCGRPPVSRAVRMQKCDHMLSWISLARGGFIPEAE